LPDFSWHNIPKQGKISQTAPKLPNSHNIYEMAVIYFKWPHNVPTFSIPRPSKIDPNWDFWYENMPSGNPDADEGFFVWVSESGFLCLWHFEVGAVTLSRKCGFVTSLFFYFYFLWLLCRECHKSIAVVSPSYVHM
jgi:hypothetical protein